MAGSSPINRNLDCAHPASSLPKLENGVAKLGDAYTHSNADVSQLLDLSEQAILTMVANSEDRRLPGLVKSCSEYSCAKMSLPQISKAQLRKSEEDLIHRNDAGRPGKTGIKSDSMSHLLNSENVKVSGFCYINNWILFGSSTSAPTLSEVATSSKSASSESMSNFKGKKRHTPKIVIDKPSDDEDEDFDDDYHLFEYYKKQVVLSDWEELCRDLKVTEL